MYQEELTPFPVKNPPMPRARKFRKTKRITLIIMALKLFSGPKDKGFYSF
jgi:hypothetical protein